MLPPAGYYPRAGLPAFPQATLPPAPPTALAAAPAPAPKVRLQAPDEPRPAARSTPAVVVPSPEQLGLARAASEVDWDATRGRLRQLGATSFLIDRVSGGYRFTCWLPAEQAGKSYRVEADGATQADAVRLGLERAGRWARSTQ